MPADVVCISKMTQKSRLQCKSSLTFVVIHINPSLISYVLSRMIDFELCLYEADARP